MENIRRRVAREATFNIQPPTQTRATIITVVVVGGTRWKRRNNPDTLVMSSSSIPLPSERFCLLLVVQRFSIIIFGFNYFPVLIYFVFVLFRFFYLQKKIMIIICLIITLIVIAIILAIQFS